MFDGKTIASQHLSILEPTQDDRLLVELLQEMLIEYKKPKNMKKIQYDAYLLQSEMHATKMQKMEKFIIIQFTYQIIL